MYLLDHTAFFSMKNRVADIGDTKHATSEQPVLITPTALKISAVTPDNFVVLSIFSVIVVLVFHAHIFLRTSRKSPRASQTGMGCIILDLNRAAFFL